MTKLSCYPFVILLVLLFFAGCRSAPIHNIDSHPIPVEGLSQFEIKRAIMLGCKRAEWKLLSVRPGEIIANYSAKRGKYSASVKISYDKNSYSINYLSSKNLNYSSLKSDTENPAQVISEINPFEETPDASSQDPSKPKQVIHKVYNQWVQALQSEIDLALLLPTTATRSASHSSTSVSIPSESGKRCNHVPDQNLTGHIQITGSKVNIRSGIGKRCSIIFTAAKGDIFPTLGKKGNWTQIEIDSDQTAWVYSSLVKKTKNSADIARANSQSSSSTSQDKPAAPPPPPSKKISIAVIHFKTLNQKAQEIELGNLVSEMFTTKLVNSQSFKIIEREQLNKVVNEMEMNQTGFIEASDAVQVGKMLHADAIITGSVALLGNQIQINARIIEIESAYVLDADTKSNTYTLRNMSRIVENMVRKFSLSLR